MSKGLLLAAALLLPVSVHAAKKPQMTPLEIQALQSHEYETSKEILFASVVSVFQDLGYQLENADMPSGFITASSATTNKTNLLEAFAGMRSSGNTRATAFVEAMPGGHARVRINFLNSKSSSGQYGQSSKNDRTILDPATYNAAWEKIDEAIFVRAAGNAPTAVPVAPAAIDVPVTAGTPISVAPAAEPQGK